MTANKLRETLGDVVYQIRFSSMKFEEFVDLIKRHEGFFTPDESIEIFYIIGKLEGFEPQKFNKIDLNENCRDLSFARLYRYLPSWHLILIRTNRFS